MFSNMPSQNSKDTDCLSKISYILPALTGGILFALLLYLCFSVNMQIQQERHADDFFIVSDYECLEVEDPDAPIGVIKQYRFIFDKELEKDTYLSFYTVHQYVEIYIDGQFKYGMKPSSNSFIRTVGSNWTMFPLYREDAGKEIRVNIIPIYESFRNRKVEFLLGSRISICADRLRQDWSQILLSMMAIFVGIIFLCIAIYMLLHKHGSDGLAFLGLFSVMIGLWRLTDTRFTPFLAPTKPLLMFYISVGMLMIGVIPFMKSMGLSFDKKRRRILDTYCQAVSIICIIQILLQVFCGIDIRENFVIIHLVIAVGCLLFVGDLLFVRFRCTPDPSGIIDPKASLILIAGVLADVAFFYVRGTSSGLLFSLLGILIFIIITGISMMFHYIEQERKLAEKERQLTESHISTMISQIRPHFIYNTLGSIEQLCELDPKTAANVVHNFARYLRCNFSELENTAPIRLSQELEHIRYYVSIEQIRFPDITVNIDVQTDDFLLPALSVQPLVENAIKHGLMKLSHGGTVNVSSYETYTRYFVCVEDDGAGFDPDTLLDESKHIGLNNIRGRLAAMCNGTLTLKSTPGAGTKVTISIPKEV